MEYFENMLTTEDINSAYFFLLGRAPESESVIASWLSKGLNASTLRDTLLESTEFKNKYITNIFPSHVIIFIHIPKTAGTALRKNWLLKNLENNWYWFDMPGHRANWCALQKNNMLASTNRMIGGHKHIVDFMDLNLIQPKTYLSVIREPVDRAISYFNFIKASAKHQAAKSLQGKSLLQAVKETGGFAKLIGSDEQINYLFHSTKTLSERDNIIIGKQEYIDDFLGTSNEALSFERITGEGSLVHANVGKESYKEKIMNEDGYDEAISILTNKLAREIEFYNSFDSVLNLDAQEYDVVRRKIFSTNNVKTKNIAS